MRWSVLFISAAILAVTSTMTGIFKFKVSTIEGIKTELETPLENKNSLNKNKDITEPYDTKTEENAAKIKDSMFLKDKTLMEANEHLNREADRQGFSEEKKAEIIKTFERLSGHMPAKEAYKLILIRFNLIDIEKFKEAGNSDYEKSVGVMSR
ncbi:MAG TPA: hypothetical protein DHV16_00540 [Nitrospiraceae bacterium]|nr:hypothetical protein [Nitrospiraceae bacterium]